MNYRAVTLSLLPRIVEMHRDGSSTREIAHDLQISKSNVQKLLADKGRRRSTGYRSSKAKARRWNVGNGRAQSKR